MTKGCPAGVKYALQVMRTRLLLLSYRDQTAWYSHVTPSLGGQGLWNGRLVWWFLFLRRGTGGCVPITLKNDKARHISKTELLITVTSKQIPPIPLFLFFMQKGLKIVHHADSTLASFCAWQKNLNPQSDTHPAHHDVAVLITRQVHKPYFG